MEKRVKYNGKKIKEIKPLTMCGGIQAKYKSKENKFTPKSPYVFLGGDGQSGYWFVPKIQNKEYPRDNWLYIDDMDFDSFSWAVRKIMPEFDWWGDNIVNNADFEKMLNLWQFICTAKTFDEMFETVCEVNYKAKTIAKSSPIHGINSCGATFWKEKEKHIEMYNDFRRWFDLYKNESTHIIIAGP